MIKPSKALVRRTLYGLLRVFSIFYLLYLLFFFFGVSQGLVSQSDNRSATKYVSLNTPEELYHPFYRTKFRNNIILRILISLLIPQIWRKLKSTFLYVECLWTQFFFWSNLLIINNFCSYIWNTFRKVIWNFHLWFECVYITFYILL